MLEMDIYANFYIRFQGYKKESGIPLTHLLIEKVVIEEKYFSASNKKDLFLHYFRDVFEGNFYKHKSIKPHCINIQCHSTSSWVMRSCC